MLHDDVVALAKHRLQQAHDCLKLAEAAIGIAYYKGAANRSYYAVFHCMRAVLAFDNYDSKKHSGIIAAFRQRYIKTGKFPAHFSKIIGSIFELRTDSDYEDFYVVSKEAINLQFENAKAFYDTTEEYISKLI